MSYHEIKPELPEGVVPISEHIRNSKPICNGFYPHEVLLLSYAPRYTTKQRNTLNSGCINMELQIYMKNWKN